MALTRQEGRMKQALLYFVLILQIQLYQAESTDDNSLETPGTRLLLRRILRDTSGHYHPELHGDHAFQGQGQFHSIQVHSHGAGGRLDGTGSSISASSSSRIDNNNEVHHHEEVIAGPVSSTLVRTGSSSGYTYPVPPPPVPVDNGPVPEGAANCGCVPIGRCADSQKSFTDFVIQTGASTLVCGGKYDLCCFDDPWPGVVDNFQHLAPCVPVELCAYPYGISATDVRDYGVIGPCPGLGSVRCLDNKVPVPSSPPQQPEGPTHIVIPIIEQPLTPSTPVVPELPVPTTVYEPPVVYAPPAPVTEPPVVYAPPAPVTEPPVVYAPPAPVTEPPVVYAPPAPVTEPTGVYDYPPAPVAEQPITYSPPSTSYGVPGLPIGQPFGYSGKRFGGYPYAGFGGYSRGFGRAYPYYNNGLGFGFRKHIGFSKGFGFYG
jgi:hypothetical protein